MQRYPIQLKKVSVHNLKNVDLTLATHELILFTGVSGSGKSSMAFDTLYVEGQRRYIESLSTFTKRSLGGEMSKPQVESVTGLSPTIAIEQKSVGKNPRSTVGTLTEIYDYLRLLFALIATPYCPVSKKPVASTSRETLLRLIQAYPINHRLSLLAPYAQAKKGEFKEEFAHLLKKGFMKVRVDGQWVHLEAPPLLDKNQTHTIDIVVDRLKLNEETRSRLSEAILQGLEIGNGMIRVIDHDNHEQEQFFSTYAYSEEAKCSYPPLEPSFFSFNHPLGMCDTCHGLGYTQSFDLHAIIDPSLSISENCCLIAPSCDTVRYGNIYRNLAEIYDFSLDTPWSQLSNKAKQIFLYGVDKKWIKMHFIHPDRPASWTDYVVWKGVIGEAMKRYAEATSEGYRKKMEELMVEQTCPTCHGSRLKAYPAAASLFGQTISELTQLPIAKLRLFFETLVLDPIQDKIAGELVKEILRRLLFLKDVGLGYLCLNRTAPTLSGGEAQRVRLAAQIGSGLVGVTYILDEPSIGLHPQDNTKLIASLKQLRDSGNTVIVVEHDEETIRSADRVVDFGPGPGKLGGHILVNGSVEDLLAHPTSLTAQYLTGKKHIAAPHTPRQATGFLTLYGACHHNLKNCTLTLPLGVMTVITGVSGSGKSSLICQTLDPALSRLLHRSEQPCGAYERLEGVELIDKVISIDQSPIGRTPRSNPATYIKVFDDIRELFADLPESKAKGFTAGRFSFNVKEGSCQQCHGIGMQRIDMDFLEDQWVICPNCHNKRFDAQTLSITYKGKTIHDVLELTIAEALELFSAHPKIVRKLQLLAQVGLDYMTLGQSSTTLSGGEAQRIKLAKELVRPASGKTLYLLDEPTTGLHFHDIAALLDVLNRLVDKGNTVVIIEHNLDMIKQADWVIELGPGAGDEGGTIVAQMTPQLLAKQKTATAYALAHQQLQKDALVDKQLLPPPEEIRIQGAEQNNLKHLDVSIPRGKITVCTGPSGSGKSSLAFDTIYAEGQRRYVESLSAYARQFVKQMPKPKLTQIDGLSPSIAIEQKLTSGNPRSTVGTQTEIYDYLRILFSQAGIAYDPQTKKPVQKFTLDSLTDQLLTEEEEQIMILAPVKVEGSFEELCQHLQKQGFLRLRLDDTVYDLTDPIAYDKKKKQSLALVIDRLKIKASNRSRLFEALEKAQTLGKGELIIHKQDQDHKLSFQAHTMTPHQLSFNHADGMCQDCSGLGLQYGAHLEYNSQLMQLSILELCELFWTYTDLPFFFQFLEKEGIDLNTPIANLSEKHRHLLLKGSSDPIKYCGAHLTWQGLEPTLAWLGKHAHAQIRYPLLPLLDELECSTCQGTRLNLQARNIKIGPHSIASLCAMPLEEASVFLQQQGPKDAVLEDVLAQILQRLSFLIDVGLGYLSLDRRAPTLSNGEAARIRLARQLGSELTGVLYVLDEPTIGLHPHDNVKLSQALTQLKNLGNTLLLVEHDPLTMQMADHILEFGPGSGKQGGHLIFQGSYKQMLQSEHSLTGAYLSGRKALHTRTQRRPFTGSISIKNASVRNLKNLSFELPLGLLCTLTGVSGSGKSTLLHEVLAKQTAHFDKILIIDQNPIGQTARADVGTYTDIITTLRSFYAKLPEASTRGLQPRHFSTNHKKGMCSHCQGMGYKRIDRLFLPPVKITCERCHGMRLNPVSLSVKYLDHHFGQLLQLTIDQAYQLFSFLPKAQRQLHLLQQVGLGYLTLGQEVASLSGGEAQRLKLSKELSKRGTKQTLYLLDEPTTGLHLDDIDKLLGVLNRLVDKGSSCIVIEHNIDFIKASDYIIDMGPGPGKNGGKIIAIGTPEQIKKNPTSITGRFL